MKRLLIIPLVLLVAACCNQQADRMPAMQQVASFRLGDNTELRLVSDSNLSQVELYYGGELQELAGTANTLFSSDDNGRIVLDTVHLGGDSLATQYIVRTYDRSSTYGAEVWYVVYPFRHDDPDGPWSLVKLPTDRPALDDVARYID
jgi:hypothetical protein